MSDEVELRLRNLSSSAVLRPADESAIARIAPGSRRSHRRAQIAAAAAAALIAILLANVVAAYFAPKYQRALADSGVGPISQRFLSAVGLKDGDVTTLGDSVTSAGHTLRLEGGYADGLRTVLFVSIDGKGVTGNPKRYGLNPGEWGINYNYMTLTDQFGQTYGGVGVGGPTDLQFEALKWPASELGGRMTLSITGIEATWKIAGFGPNKVIDTDALTTHGDWTLHATLISAPAHSIALPAPVHADKATYAFTGISASETEMVVHWTVSGPVIEPFRTPPAPASLVDPWANPLFDQYLRPHVYSEAGIEQQFQDFGYGWPKSGPGQGEMTVFIAGPGRYRIQIGTVAPASWVVVP